MATHRQSSVNIYLHWLITTESRAAIRVDAFLPFSEGAKIFRVLLAQLPPQVLSFATHQVEGR
jgi:hypothetical protein